MIPSKMFGKPLEVITVVKNQIQFNSELLQDVLLKCGDRPLAIYSVAGEYRKGKSFLLNLFLLFNHYHQNDEDWMEKASGEIGGFKAKGGSDRVTSGIWFWSEPIFAKDKAGQDVAILLMDTQGTFDRKTTSAVNSFIFGFSIAFSSVTMYNVKEDVTEQDLDNLATFAQSVQHLTGSFQTVKFVVRDWLDDSKYFHGPEGGKKMIAEMFDLDENFNEKDEEEDGSQKSIDDQLIETRKVIRDIFESISGFLFPPPGERIAKAQSKPVKVKYMDLEFKRSVDQLCRELFVDKITIRESDGKQWTAETFGKKFDKMAEAYATGMIVDPGTFREAVGKKIALAANQFAFHSYMEWVEKEIFAEQENTKQIFVDENFLIEQDKIYRIKALGVFREKVKPFGTFEKVEELLLLNISKWLEQKENANRQSIKRKFFEEEKRKLDDEKRELELQNRRLQLQAELQLTLKNRNEAEEAAREEEERRKLEEEEEKRRLEDEIETERKLEEEFDFIQSENLARIEVIERRRRWWEHVVDFLSSTAGLVAGGGVAAIGGILLICLLL